MVRIRKKPSKRTSTSHRAKIKHKVAESRHKQRKVAKKNPQWKSRHEKDPGIPSSLPFKAEILAEIEQQRRKTEEDKQLKKAAKAAQLKADRPPQDEAEDGNVSEDGADGVTLVASSSVRKAKKTPKSDQMQPESEVEDADDVPILVDSSLPDLSTVYAEADAIIHLIDARNPWPHIMMNIDSVSKGQAKKVMHVYTKIDLIPREVAQYWIRHPRARQDNKPLLLFQAAGAFVSECPREGVKGKGKVTVEDAKGRDAVLEVLGKWASERNTDGKDFTVAVIGLPNSGKSAFINTLLSTATLPVYGPSTLLDPTTTPSAQVVTLTVGERSIRLIDTPGFTLGPDGLQADEGKSQTDDSLLKAYDLLVRNKGKIERAKDAMSAVNYLVHHAEREDLMLLYNTPAFTSGDVDGFLKGVARSIGRVKRGGVLDTDAAARSILRDWSVGNILYCMPLPKPEEDGVQPADTEWNGLYERADQEALSGLRSRADFRRAGGFLRLKGEVRFRPLVVQKWIGTHEDPTVADDEGDEGDEEWTGFGDADDDSEEDDEDEDDEDIEDQEGDDEQDESSRPRKRKRPSSPAATPSPKKVAFAEGTKPASLPSSARKSKITVPKRVGNVVVNGKGRSKDLKQGEEAYDFSRFF